MEFCKLPREAGSGEYNAETSFASNFSGFAKGLTGCLWESDLNILLKIPHLKNRETKKYILKKLSVASSLSFSPFVSLSLSHKHTHKN
jgi:hypothetical protein